MQNRIQTIESRSANIQLPFLSKPTRKIYFKAGAVALAVILHFASQFFLFQSKNIESDVALAQTEYKPNNKPNNKPSDKSNNRRGAAIKKQSKAKSSDVKKTSAPAIAAAPSVVRRKQEAPAASRTTPKKKDFRESRAERLRRTERFLTGA